MNGNINLSPSQEDYLEAILSLETNNRVARVKDIAEFLNVRMPSVTGALKQLRTKELIDYEKNSFITLTEKGKILAEKIFERHNSLAHFFQDILFMDKEKAQDEACKAEHSISQETIKRLSQVSLYIQKNIFPNMDRNEWKQILLKGRDK